MYRFIIMYILNHKSVYFRRKANSFGNDFKLIQDIILFFVFMFTEIFTKTVNLSQLYRRSLSVVQSLCYFDNLKFTLIRNVSRIGQIFNRRLVRHTIIMFFTNSPADLFQTGIQILIPLNVINDHFEKKH